TSTMASRVRRTGSGNGWSVAPEVGVTAGGFWHGAGPAGSLELVVAVVAVVAVVGGAVVDGVLPGGRVLGPVELADAPSAEPVPCEGATVELVDGVVDDGDCNHAAPFNRPAMRCSDDPSHQNVACSASTSNWVPDRSALIARIVPASGGTSNSG